MSALLDNDVFEVLHVDDNRGDLELTCAAFQDCCPDIHYHGVADPREALAYLGRCGARGAPPPSLVMLDLNMPRVRGVEVLAFIRRHPALDHVPVVVLTTSTQSSEVDACRRMGAAAVLTKPASYDDLVKLVRTMMDRLS